MSSGPIRFRCACGEVIRVPASWAGKRGKCPKCGAVVVCAAPAAPPPAASGPVPPPPPRPAPAGATLRVDVPARPPGPPSPPPLPARALKPRSGRQASMRWLATGERLGYQHFWFLFACDNLIVLTTTITSLLTCGLGLPFLALHLLTGFLLVHLRCLRGQPRELSNVFEAFRFYPRILALAFINLAVMIVVMTVVWAAAATIMYSWLAALWAAQVEFSLFWVLSFVVVLVLYAILAVVFALAEMVFVFAGLLIADQKLALGRALSLAFRGMRNHALTLAANLAVFLIVAGIWFVVCGNLLFRPVLGSLIGLAGLALGYGHVLIVAPAWLAVVYESVFPDARSH